jgi:uncharacterized membrane protein YdbT with pleckstrin-like domain
MPMDRSRAEGRNVPNEEPVWSATPSQVVNMSAFVLLGLIAWLVVPIFIIVWKWLVVRNTRYELTTERLITRRGVLNKVTDQVELYRVRDYQVERPFFLRLFGLSDVTLKTSDVANPVVVLRAIPNGEQVKDQIRGLVEQCRVAKGVRALDVEAHPGT